MLGEYSETLTCISRGFLLEAPATVTIFHDDDNHAILSNLLYTVGKGRFVVKAHKFALPDWNHLRLATIMAAPRKLRIAFVHPDLGIGESEHIH